MVETYPLLYSKYLMVIKNMKCSYNSWMKNIRLTNKADWFYDNSHIERNCSGTKLKKFFMLGMANE